MTITHRRNTRTCASPHPPLSTGSGSPLANGHSDETSATSGLFLLNDPEVDPNDHDHHPPLLRLQHQETKKNGFLARGLHWFVTALADERGSACSVGGVFAVLLAVGFIVGGAVEWTTRLAISNQNQQEQPWDWLQVLSSCVGYTYLFCWSISFYPQAVMNYRLRSTQGVSPDFVLLNTVGFACYSVYNTAMYASPIIHQLYHERYGTNAHVTVQSNDVAFALHALVLSSVILAQKLYYNGLTTTIPSCCGGGGGGGGGGCKKNQQQPATEAPERARTRRRPTRNHRRPATPSAVAEVPVPLVPTTSASSSSSSLASYNSQDNNNKDTQVAFLTVVGLSFMLVAAILYPLAVMYDPKILQQPLHALEQFLHSITAQQVDNDVQEEEQRKLALDYLTTAHDVAVADADASTNSYECNWLDYLYLLSSFKIAITLSKYVPQVILNARRKSTSGVSMQQFWMDLQGGMLSNAQLVLDCARFDDWTGLTGNLPKLCLGSASMLFDVVFFIQHYYLYADSQTHDDQPQNEDRTAPIVMTTPLLQQQEQEMRSLEEGQLPSPSYLSHAPLS